MSTPVTRAAETIVPSPGQNRAPATREIVADIFVLVVLTAFFIGALSFSARARLMPLLVSGVSIAAILAELCVRVILKKGQALALDPDQLLGADKKKEELSAASEAGRLSQSERGPLGKGGSEIGGFVWLFGLLVIIVVFGFSVAEFVFPMLYLRLSSRTGWRAAITAGLVTFLIVYLFFDRMLGLKFWPGRVFGGRF